MDAAGELGVGRIYEDCAFHAVLCTAFDGDDLVGISLIDGSYPRSCSVAHCGPVPLTLEQAVRVRTHFDEWVRARRAAPDSLPW